jgi:triosephosphate isomerase
MRLKIVAGNWKMNMLKEEGESLTSDILKLVSEEKLDNSVKLIIAPPAIHLANLSSLTKGQTQVSLAAQNVHQENKGAFTGEISANMLASFGLEYVIIGHSERRQYFAESDELLAQKVKSALEQNLHVIFCCGEGLAIRQAGEHLAYVSQQLTNGVFDLPQNLFEKVIVAYEPIWAIGTGETASSEQAQEMHAHLRQHIASKYGKQTAENTSILYGGSCKPSNAKELFSCVDVDGGLIGGASLKAKDFVTIAQSF